MKWTRCLQPAYCMMTRGVRHANPAFATSQVEIYLACCWISRFVHGPGMTITGLTFPSSAVNLFNIFGLRWDLFLRLSSPDPKTIISYLFTELFRPGAGSREGVQSD